MPKISVITVCYNDAEALVPTLRSITSQTYSDYELIVQDGGSSDNTDEIVAGFGDWIDSYESEPDKGIYQAMNRAVARAKGEYCLFMNAADSFLSHETLELFANEILDSDDILYGHAISSETGEIVDYRPAQMFWLGMIHDHQATLARTSLLQEMKLNEDLKIAGDYDFFSRCRLKNVRFRNVPVKVARKPFAVGASSDFMDRFRERYHICMQYFGNDYPVDACLSQELTNHIVRRFGYAHAEKEIESQPIDKLISLYDKLSAIEAY